MYNYYFAIASKSFLVDKEPLEEILRERTTYYKSINKDIDFWFIVNPDFINMPSLQNIKAQLKTPAAAIVSFDKQFIQWLKLRIGFVAIGTFQTSDLIKI